MAEDELRIRLVKRVHDLRPARDDAMRELDEIPFAAGQKLYELSQKIGQYHSSDPPHKAVYILGECKAHLEYYASACGTIKRYEEAQAKLEEYDMRKAIENG